MNAPNLRERGKCNRLASTPHGSGKVAPGDTVRSVRFHIPTAILLHGREDVIRSLSAFAVVLVPVTQGLNGTVRYKTTSVNLRGRGRYPPLPAPAAAVFRWRGSDHTHVGAEGRTRTSDWLFTKQLLLPLSHLCKWRTRQDLNPQPSPYKGAALPLELLVRLTSCTYSVFKDRRYEPTRFGPHPTIARPKPVSTPKCWDLLGVRD
jgi:hypothetical protein